MPLFQKIIHNLFVRESGLKRYFLNTSWLLIARIVQMLVSLVVGGMVARYLGPENYGTYNYVISFVGLFAALSTLGIASVVVKDLLSGTVNPAVAMGSGFFLKIAGSIIAFILVALCTFLIEDAAAVRWLLLIASVQTITKSAEIINAYYQAKVASKRTVQAQMVSLLLVSSLRVVFIFTHQPLQWFIMLLPLDAIIIGSILTRFLRNSDAAISKWKLDTSYARQLLKESWPSLFSGLFVTVYMKIDQVMLQDILDASAVGWYAAAVRLSEVWISIPWILAGSLFPAIVNAYKESKDLFITRINQAYILLLSIALIVAIPVAIGAPFIIHLIFGTDYTFSVSVLQVHIFSCVFIFLGSISNRWLVLEKKQQFWMYYSGLGAVSNILLNLLLIPRYGIMGAAYATLISYAFAYYFAFALFPSTRAIFVSQTRNFVRVLTVIPAIKEIRKLRIR